MALNDKKISAADLTGKGVIGLPDVPGLSTADMQSKLEEIARDVIVPKHNALVDALTATEDGASGADNIGATPIGSGTAETVQGVLEQLQTGKLDASAVEQALTDDAEKVPSGAAVTDALSGKVGTSAVEQSLTSGADKIPSSAAVTAALSEAGYGDMLKTVYDTDNDGKVDAAEASDDSAKLGGELPAYYGTAAAVIAAAEAAAAAQSTADAAMPKAGGTFTGEANAINTNRTGSHLRNNTVYDSSGNNQVSTNYLIFRRK